MTDTYRSIAGPSEGFFRDRGSKFLAFAHPVSSLEEAEQILDHYKKEYHDSRHVCFAYRIGPEGKEWRAYDAGEPSHSAGDPIFNEIRSFELTNVIVIVIRYFGGTKLGIPGLIEAYKTATQEALNQAEIKEFEETESLAIRFPYEMTSQVNRIVHQHKIQPAEADYGADCYQVFEVRKSLAPELRNVFEELNILENLNS